MEKKEVVYKVNNLKLDRYHLKLNEVLFHNANGYIGVRYDFEEGYPDDEEYIRSQYINGFYDFAPINQPEALYGIGREKQLMLNIADTQTIRLFIDDEEFSMFTGTVMESSLSLHMEEGITLRRVVWRSPKGKEIEFVITRMTSFHQLTLFTIDYEINPLNFSGNIIIESGHDVDVTNFYDPLDPRGSNYPVESIKPTSCVIQDEASYITSSTINSGLQVCSCVKHALSQESERDFSVNHNSALCRLSLEAQCKQKIKLIKYAVFCDSIRYEDCRQQAMIEIQEATSVPLTELYRKQEEYLTEYWKNCLVEIDGDKESNLAMYYNLYQLIQSVGKDKYGNIAPKGLSGDGYEGNFFWDTEIYIQPYFTITNPSITKNLIDFRYETLDMARENAKIMGHNEGALYPWKTIMGRECSGFFPAGTAQYHINGDIAYSIIAYYLATKDLDFILKKGAEIIFETARVWLDAGNFYDGKFNINSVTGPDEYTCIVNNNYYTNLLAKYHLNWAVKFYSILKQFPEFTQLAEKISLTEGEIDSFAQAADQMYLAYDEELNINPQDDSFLQKKKWDISLIPKKDFPMLLNYHPLHLYRYQICKQADTVLAYFLLEDAQPEDVMHNSFLYYEKITTHDSSLSRCIFSIMAARLGMPEKSLRYFGDSIKLDLMDLYGNTDDGVHTANMAGSYLAVVFGFGGFRLKEQGISFAPILPSNWEGYRFKICYEDSHLKVEVLPHQCIFTLESGSEKQILIYGKEYLLENTLTIPREDCIDAQKDLPSADKDKNMMYKAVIFDLDGVITHTDRYHYLAWKTIADELGIPFDEIVNNRLKGVSRADSLEIIIESYEGILTEEQKLYYTDRKNRLYQMLLENLTENDLSADVGSTLIALKEHGVKLAIGSSSKNAKMILERIGLENFFDAVSDGTNIVNSKPDPEVFLKASEYLGIEPKDCLVVEDAVAGVEAAKAAGMDCAAIGDAMKSPLADYRLDCFPDLRQIVLTNTKSQFSSEK
ncbi:MAG: beta-phosphoglucomutase [Eubacteriales bacterium]|nr:beta-phosphoglucomutase [Eubacteriales bacterium]